MNAVVGLGLGVGVGEEEEEEEKPMQRRQSLIPLQDQPDKSRAGDVDEEEGSRTSALEVTRQSSSPSSPSPSPSADEVVGKEEEDKAEMNGRERLKRHRIEVAGRVWIPEIWGQEELLKDWIDCSSFDASLVPSGVMSARAALVQQARSRRPPNPISGHFRIENRQCNDESGKIF